MGRKSQAEIQTRRTDVREMVLKGKPKSHIVAWINTHYGVALSTVENDLTHVYKDMREYWQKERDEVIAEHVNRYEHLYEQCLEIGDSKSAMQALKQKEQLMKLLEDKPLVAVQQNNVQMDLSNLSVDDIKMLLNKNVDSKS